MIIVINIKKTYRYILIPIIILLLLFVFRHNIREYFMVSYRKYYNITISASEINEMKNELNIININYDWDGELIKNNKPNKIIIHHSAISELTPEEINDYHKSRGWTGIGYNYYIRKDGTIYSGRPENSEGAHTKGENSNSIGICLEGNFEEEEVNEMQMESLLNLSYYISLKYDIYKIMGHKDAYETLCPGRNFPLKYVKNKVINYIKEY